MSKCSYRTHMPVGSLQYELVAGGAERAAETVRTLGPTYATLAALLKGH
jgi:hypothetical protein